MKADELIQKYITEAGLVKIIGTPSPRKLSHTLPDTFSKVGDDPTFKNFGKILVII